MFNLFKREEISEPVKVDPWHEWPPYSGQYRRSVPTIMSGYPVEVIPDDNAPSWRPEYIVVSMESREPIASGFIDKDYARHWVDKHLDEIGKVIERDFEASCKIKQPYSHRLPKDE